jgi:hypothetical protein
MSNQRGEGGTRRRMDDVTEHFERKGSGLKGEEKKNIWRVT